MWESPRTRRKPQCQLWIFSEITGVIIHKLMFIVLVGCTFLPALKPYFYSHKNIELLSVCFVCKICSQLFVQYNKTPTRFFWVQYGKILSLEFNIGLDLLIIASCRTQVSQSYCLIYRTYNATYLIAFGNCALVTKNVEIPRPWSNRTRSLILGYIMGSPKRQDHH